MSSYIVTSDSPISVRPIERPELPGGVPEHPWVPPGVGPEHPIVPPGEIPPPEIWPPLPPGIALPIVPSPEHPMVPIPPEVDPPEIWPPIRPEFPDFSGKTLTLALVFISRRIARLHWVVIDHEEAKARFKEIADKVRDHLAENLPAGGVGRPPQRPTPGPTTAR